MTTRIRKGVYKIKSSTFYIVHDPTLEGNFKWVIYTPCDASRILFEGSGHDQLWQTKREALDGYKYFVEELIRSYE